MHRVALYRHFGYVYPNHPTAEEVSIPNDSEDVSVPVQVDVSRSDRAGASLNRRPRVHDSWLATKWQSIRSQLNVHFQALAIMRFDGRDLQTESCYRVHNLQLIKDAAKAFMTAEVYYEFREDLCSESDKRHEPDGLRYVSTPLVHTCVYDVILCAFCAH
jgi:hypothetical protein